MMSKGLSRITQFLILAALLIPSLASAQGAGGNGVTSLPKIECSIYSTYDQLFFRGNDYVPNTISVRVTVRNISTDTAIARNIFSNLVKDTRFKIVGGPAIQKVADSLMPGDSAWVTYTLEVAVPRKVDGIDQIASIVVSSNANNAFCSQDIWVEHEYYPDLQVFCTKMFPQIIFDDNINDYSPNPFVIKVDLNNAHDGASDSTIVRFIGARGVSLDPADSSVKFVGLLNPGDIATVQYRLVPTRRSNDTTITICFQATGIGGYQRKNYIDTCCVEVFIPAAKQAAYDVNCDIVPLMIDFLNHKYSPDPFVYNARITNTGTAVGKDVKARVMLPPSLQLAAGEVAEQNLGDIPVGSFVDVTWNLRAVFRFVRDTVTVCTIAYDQFNNRGVCCDSVIVDSIRSAKFNVACSAPDTIHADLQQGVYINSPFDVTFTVCNVGSDYADSLKATIVIGSTELQLIPGQVSIVYKYTADPTGDHTLQVDSCFVFRWTIEALPRAVSGPIYITFRAEAPNGRPVESICSVYVPKIDSPNLFVWCETQPADSLHFNPATGGYLPNRIIYRVFAINEGGGVAQNVKATLALPPGVQLQDDGFGLSKLMTPANIGPTDTAVAEWITIPIEKTDVGSDAQFISEIVAENISERYTCARTVFIPALPRTAALAIPRANVGYTNQSILVPVYIDDPAGKDIKDFVLEIRYNVDSLGARLTSDVVQFDRVVLVNSLAAAWSLVSEGRNATNDVLNLHITSTVPLAYPGASTAIPPLVWLEFRAVFGGRPDDLKIAISNLLWPVALEVPQKIFINNGSIFPLLTDGKVYISGDCLRPLSASSDYVINPNRPNPFNPSTTIDYQLPVDDHVRIVVTDALGRQVAVLVDGFMTAGAHSVMFMARDLPSGMYFYRMETPHFNRVMKMTLAK
jgi:hypothetical protein